jgi:hypothetical protein
LVLEDSGNANAIYGLSPKGIGKSITIRMLKNIDWETLLRIAEIYIHRGFW